jgi:ketosteroid isomerase-like protein
MKKIMLAVFMITFIFGLSALAEEPRNTGEETLMKSSNDMDSAKIVKEVTDSFNQLLAAINKKDVVAWEKFYSTDNFVSTVTGGTFFGTRDKWVKVITANFSMRESQHLELNEVKVIPIASDTALLTSQEKAEMKLKSGQSNISKHVFTMEWKKGPEGWQIIHSHESWVDEPAK